MNRRPTVRTARIMGWLAIPAAVILSGAVIATASYSAFSATTSNPTDSWATGTVALSDDDTSTAMFTATNLKPGSTGTKCIVVTSTGSLASAVKLYGTSPATTNALSSYINLAITQGNGGSFAGGCGSFVPLATGSSLFSGTLAAFGAASTSFANGVGTWTPTGTVTETRVYQFVYTVDPAAPNSTQSGTASIGFTWEAQNS